jgi:hypothetical protein
VLLRQQREPAPLPAPPIQSSARQAPFVVALTLVGSRSAAADRIIAIPRAAAAIQLRVRIDAADRFDRYALSLRSAANTIVWSNDNLRASVEGGDTFVTGVASSRTIVPGTYELTVRGLGSGGSPIDVGFVTFEVRRTP